MAKRLKISEMLLTRHARSLGLGRCRKQNRPSPRMQEVAIDPFRWAPHTEAARAFGVNRSTISCRSAMAG